MTSSTCASPTSGTPATSPAAATSPSASSASSPTIAGGSPSSRSARRSPGRHRGQRARRGRGKRVRCCTVASTSGNAADTRPSSSAAAAQAELEQGLALADVPGRRHRAPKDQRLLQLLASLSTPAFGDEPLGRPSRAKASKGGAGVRPGGRRRARGFRCDRGGDLKPRPRKPRSRHLADRVSRTPTRFAARPARSTRSRS